MEKKGGKIDQEINLDNLRIAWCRELTRRVFVGAKKYIGLAVTIEELRVIRAIAKRGVFPPAKRKITLKINDDNVMIEIDCVLEKGEIIDFYLVDDGVGLSSGRFVRDSGALVPHTTGERSARSEIQEILGWDDIIKANEETEEIEETEDIKSLLLPLLPKAKDIFAELADVKLVLWEKAQELDKKAFPTENNRKEGREYVLLRLDFKGETMFVVVVTDQFHTTIFDVWSH